MASSRDDLVRKMARLMQSGAVMLEQTCPICGSPLFRLPNGDIVCPIHGKVRIVGSEEEASLVEAEGVLKELVAYSAKSIKRLISSGSGPEDIGRWLYVMEKALEVADKIKAESTPASQSGRAQRKPRGKAGS
ncbi:MAG: hypothetical protein GSR82_02775 [Desulfurococcales archaeon]|nr:hypothetical protein [Desulfurococcales archaeon]MEB3799454.1 hypothetical protein [Desulfurococcales archaeon]MEB3845900.1 hypothetical protein [Desulfurococcales archaeon]